MINNKDGLPLQSRRENVRNTLHAERRWGAGITVAVGKGSGRK